MSSNSPPVDFPSPTSSTSEAIIVIQDSKESWTRKYTTKLDDGRILCDFPNCKHNKEPYSSSTGNGTVVRHLRNHHLSRLLPTERGGEKMQKNTMRNYVTATRPKSEIDSKTSEKILVLIVELIVENDLSFSFIHSKALLKLIQFFNPAVLHLPSRQTVQRTILLAHQNMKMKLKEHISSLNSKVALTLDMWTSIARRSFIAVTLHYVDDNFSAKSAILEIVHLPNPHTGTAILKYLKELINEYDLVGRLMGITCDNGGNVINALRRLKKFLLKKGVHITTRRCCAHVLNLVVRSHKKKKSTEKEEEEESLHLNSDEHESDIEDEQNITEFEHVIKGSVVLYQNCTNRPSQQKTLKLRTKK
ncbi:hypothetical protein RCL1_002292 [Eukaryota sp. TZLM3-RCL]